MSVKDEKREAWDALLSAFQKMKKEEIRISYEKIVDESLPIGRSKIGGKPDLPLDFEWPYYEGMAYDAVKKTRPLSFLAQINLKEASTYDLENLLPDSGVLSFFYELMAQEGGFDPADQGCAKVYYFPDETELVPTNLPNDMEEECRIPEFRVRMETMVSLPEYWDLEGKENQIQFCVEKDDWDWEDYNECRAEIGYEEDDWGDRTKLLGYPDVIQGPMEEECESVTRGYQLGTPEDYERISEAEEVDILEKSKEWMLLFQMGTIESDDYTMMFGDCGHIYFRIRKQELQEKNFDNVWLILQCS